MPATLRMLAVDTRLLPITSIESMRPACASCARRAGGRGTARRAAAQAAAAISRCIVPGPATLRLRARERTELQALAVAGGIHLDLFTAGELADQDLLGQRVLDVLLDRA